MDFFVASTHLGTAVAMVSGTVAQGVIRMVQLSNNNCVFEGTIDGLTPGQHALAIHEAGDLSLGCDRLVFLLYYYYQYSGLLTVQICKRFFWLSIVNNACLPHNFILFL